jgi:hypothetical protein
MPVGIISMTEFRVNQLARRSGRSEPTPAWGETPRSDLIQRTQHEPPVNIGCRAG